MDGEERIDAMIDAIMKVARGDYSAQIELSDKNDELDSLGIGINMMIDDIKHSNEETQREKNGLNLLSDWLNLSFLTEQFMLGRTWVLMQ